MECYITTQYLEKIVRHLQKIHDKELQDIRKVARMLADHIKKDKIIYAYVPGGQPNLGSQEIF